MWSIFTDYNDADKQETRHIYMKMGCRVSVAFSGGCRCFETRLSPGVWV